MLQGICMCRQQGQVSSCSLLIAGQHIQVTEYALQSC
jgi:hypothetical protein